MNLEDMRAVQQDERSSDGIQDLPDAFYQEVTAYIEELRAERAALLEDADDLYGSEEVRQLTDEIETAQEVAEAIYDRRLAKIVKHASLAAAGMATEETGLTEEESTLYTDLVDRIETHREGMIDQFAGNTTGDRTAPTGASDEPTGASGTDPAPADTDRSDPDVPTGDETAPDTEQAFDVSDAIAAPEGEHPDSTPSLDGGQPPPSEAGTSRESVEPADTEQPGTDPPVDGPSSTAVSAEEAAAGNPDPAEEATGETLLRITRDVGEIMGVDERVYELAAGDVVSLPTRNADPLLERDAAERIE